MTRAVGFGTAAVAAAAGIVVLIAGSDQESGSQAVLSAVLAVVVGWAYIGSGLVAWQHRSNNRLGPVMVFIGFAWFLSFLAYSNHSVPFTLGTAVEDIYFVGFVYLVLTFPKGELTRAVDRALVAAAVLLATVVEVAWLLFADSDEVVCGGCPDNALEVVRNDALAEGILQAQRLSALVLCVLTVFLFVSRTRRASPPQRRAAAPVLWTGAAMFAALAVTIVNDVADEPLGPGPNFMRGLVFGAIPVSILAVLLQRRLARGAVAELVVEIGGGSAPADLRDALSRALGDPGLQLAYWIPATETYVDSDGQSFRLPDNDSGLVTTVVERDGEPVAVLVHDEALRDDPDLVDSVCAAAGMTLDNERLRAELLARLSELRASRARLVRATESERRRIERDLHDGAQQRLVSIAMTLSLAESKLTTDPQALGPVLQEAREGLTQAMAELRALSQGIRPAVLVERGLGAALDDLARRSTVPVRLDLRPDHPVSTETQAAAYFVASEALANVGKHSHASEVVITLTTDGTRMRLEISDDGIGGAAPDAGSGLRGLADRVEGLGGSLSVSSPVGQGTHLVAELPCA